MVQIGLTSAGVPSLFRQSAKINENQPSLMNVKLSTRMMRFEQVTLSADCYSEITQIYEGTNQVQRVVMARQLLKG